jgi:glycosyltransferase involved in cell wall biosynthesis
MQPEKALPSSPQRPLRIVYLTAGAAGMICGSCLHDNTLARELIKLGHDVQLIPLYTPLRTDEPSVAQKRVFFGGINMYLQQRTRFFRALPKWLDRWLDRPWLITWASGRSVRIDPSEVADLTLSILRGTHGFQRKEVERLVDGLLADGRPDVVVFSNMLTAGCVPEIKRRLGVPVVVTLQGDDIFLRGLPAGHRAEALTLIGELGESIDAFIANSRFYADAMAAYMGLPRERIEIVPLGVQVEDFSADQRASERASRPPTIGYLARLAPEKGLHLLADAFIRLRAMPGMDDARLKIAGWLGGQNRPYFEKVMASLRAAGLGEAVEHVGEIDRAGKVEFLRSLDVLSVPTTYEEPKGLFVLEALASGVPVVVPEHGAFPEMLGETGGGLLHRPTDAGHLAERLHELLRSHELRQQLAKSGREQVRAKRNANVMAERTLEVLRGVVAGHR